MKRRHTSEASGFLKFKRTAQKCACSEKSSDGDIRTYVSDSGTRTRHACLWRLRRTGDRRDFGANSKSVLAMWHATRRMGYRGRARFELSYGERSVCPEFPNFPKAGAFRLSPT